MNTNAYSYRLAFFPSAVELELWGLSEHDLVEIMRTYGTEFNEINSEVHGMEHPVRRFSGEDCVMLDNGLGMPIYWLLEVHL